MKKQNHLARLLGWTVALAGVLSLGHMARADVVYANTNNPEATQVFLQSGFEFGDEVNLAGGVGTFLTNFVFQYYGSNFSGNESVDLRIYADNGPEYYLSNSIPAPGDLLFDSGAITNIPATSGSTISFSGTDFGAAGGVPVSSNFTWTVTFGGISAGESAGLFLYTAPSVGSGYDQYWEFSGPTNTWVSRVADDTNLDLSFASLAQGQTAVDASPPTVTIKVPANKAKLGLTNAGFSEMITVSGTAVDKQGLALVLFRNGTNGTFTPATLNNGAWSTPNGSVSYGPNNFLSAKSINKAGLESAIAVNQVTLNVYQTLTVNVNQPTNTTDTVVGSPTSVGNGAILQLGKAYKLTAKPDSLSLFSNWTASANSDPFTVASTSPKLSFVMNTNLVIDANFSANRFFAVTGSYNGLFTSTNGTQFTNSGFFTVKITDKATKVPSFSVKFAVGGRTYSGAGTFGLDGVGSLKKPISRAKQGLSSLICQLVLPLDGSNTITGTVGDVTNWTSTLDGAMIYGGTAFDDTYTIAIPSFGSNIGNGYGTLTIIDGVTKLTGKLADGQKFVQTTKVYLHADGSWPLYVAEDKVSGTAGGALMGWATATNGPTFGLGSDPLTWIKTGVNATKYLSGFTNTVTLNASPYTNQVPVIPLTLFGGLHVGTLSLNNGGLVGNVITNGVTLSIGTGKNKFAFDAPNANKLALSVSPKTGVLTVSLKEGGTTKGGGNGVVLQNQNLGLGYFIMTDSPLASGSFLLQ